MVINGVAYNMKEVFGLKDVLNALEGEEEGNECLICLTNIKDTMIFPCGHLCLCRECA